MMTHEEFHAALRTIKRARSNPDATMVASAPAHIEARETCAECQNDMSGTDPFPNVELAFCCEKGITDGAISNLCRSISDALWQKHKRRRRRDADREVAGFRAFQEAVAVLIEDGVARDEANDIAKKMVWSDHEAWSPDIAAVSKSAGLPPKEARAMVRQWKGHDVEALAHGKHVILRIKNVFSR